MPLLTLIPSIYNCMSDMTACESVALPVFAHTAVVLWVRTLNLKTFCAAMAPNQKPSSGK